MPTEREITITIIDPVFCRMETKGVPLFWDDLSYTQEVWKDGPFHKIRKEYRFSFLAKDGMFLAGFLPRIMDAAAKRNVKINWYGCVDELPPSGAPRLKGIELREDQYRLVGNANAKQRGVLLSATGTGKTVLGMAIISCFPEARTLFLCHEKTLMQQTYEEMLDKGFTSVSLFGGGHKQAFKKITVGMVQSIASLDPEVYRDYFNMVIVDECHIGFSPGSQYFKILTSLPATVRLGLTATLPNQTSHKLTLEGLLGPVIGQVTVGQGVSLGLLAKPRIKIIKVPYSHVIRELRPYKDVYVQGVVNNTARNSLLVGTVVELLGQGLTVLVLVTRVEHGQNLVRLFQEQGHDVPFVWGNTEDEERTAMRKALQQKKVTCVIANAVWRHGINIPSLGAVVNAAGEKSEVATLQRIGRGLRTTEEKKEVLLVDFFDQSHPFLVSHFGHRMALYCDEGWV